jgi:adenylosuccinate synthase
LLISAGALIDVAILRHEIELCGLDPERLGVDRNAGILEPSDRAAEQSERLRDRIGSTGMGVGSAVSRRVLRTPDFRLAADVPELRPFLTAVSEEVTAAIAVDQNVVVEGTQGFGLSLYHTEKWPFCTSRDTTAFSFLGEVGVGVQDVNVILAIRTFPIRVAGNSGPLPNEIGWNDVRVESGYPHEISELTTTTKRVRRVARFDWEIVYRAVRANAPRGIALHGADYLDYANKGVREFNALTQATQVFVDEVEKQTGVPVILVGTGPTQDELVDRGLLTARHTIHSRTTVVN